MGEEKQVAQVGGKGAPVRDVHLHAPAKQARVLLRHRLEEQGAEAHAGQLLGLQGLGEGPGVEPGCAHELERPRGAAAFGEVGALDEAAAGIDESGVDGGHVGRGLHPGQAGIFERHLPFPAPHADDLHLHVEPTLFAEEQGQLADGEAVAHGKRVQAHEGGEGGFEEVALHRHPPEGVRAVEHHDLLALPGAGLEDVEHGVDEGVVARAHVLQVHDHRVETGERPRRGGARASVEAVHGEAGAVVAAVVHLHQVLRVRPDAVLGAEEGGELEAAGGQEGEGGVDEVGAHRGRIGHEAEAGPA